MTQEALKLALEFIENSECGTADLEACIKEALAQPEQEPFGYFKAEPFGWTDCAESDVGAIALYQTPPRRTWVGLTDEEISELIRATHNTGSFVRAIEAKLKEKNA